MSCGRRVKDSCGDHIWPASCRTDLLLDDCGCDVPLHQVKSARTRCVVTRDRIKGPVRPSYLVYAMRLLVEFANEDHRAYSPSMSVYLLVDRGVPVHPRKLLILWRPEMDSNLPAWQDSVSDADNRKAIGVLVGLRFNIPQELECVVNRLAL